MGGERWGVEGGGLAMVAHARQCQGASRLLPTYSPGGGGGGHADMPVSSPAMRGSELPSDARQPPLPTTGGPGGHAQIAPTLARPAPRRTRAYDAWREQWPALHRQAWPAAKVLTSKPSPRQSPPHPTGPTAPSHHCCCPAEPRVPPGRAWFAGRVLPVTVRLGVVTLPLHQGAVQPWPSRIRP